MEKSKLQDKALDISHKIIKEKYGILEPAPGIVSEDDLDGEWEEVKPEDFENVKKKLGG